MLKEMSNLQFSDFTLNRHLRELRRDGVLLPVSGKAFDLLAYMVENPGRPLSKSELLDAVWPETSVEEANLSQNVFLLRKVLGSGAEGPIKTLPGRGYQFAAQVTPALLELIPQTHRLPASEPESVTGSALTLEATHTRMVVESEVEEQISFPLPRVAGLAAAAIVLALAGWFGWTKWQRWLDHTGGDPVQVVLTARCWTARWSTRYGSISRKVLLSRWCRPQLSTRR
jgi:adenylate cyclase